MPRRGRIKDGERDGKERVKVEEEEDRRGRKTNIAQV
jgi:hypothetical protein